MKTKKKKKYCWVVNDNSENGSGIVGVFSSEHKACCFESRYLKRNKHAVSRYELSVYKVEIK